MPLIDSLDARNPVTRRELLKTSALAGAAIAVACQRRSIASDLQTQPHVAVSGTASGKSRAIVIGIDKTSNVGRTLHAPIKDATRFVSWLITDAHVEASEIAFLRAPDSAAAPSEGVRVFEATRRNILQQMAELRPGQGERLYFYFSGHGTRLDRRGISSGAMDAIVPSDFDKSSSPPIPIDWILGFFRNSPFDEQFFFIDACRTLSDVTPVGADMSPVNPRGSNLPTPQQYYIHSTSPNCTSPDTGLFTEAFLQAVSKAKGSAKRYDPAKRKYFARWGEVARFIHDYYADPRNKIILRTDDGEDRPLEPQTDEHGTDRTPTKPIIGEFSQKDVTDVRLTLTIAPPDALKELMVEVRAEDARPETFPPPIGIPLSLSLQPRSYALTFQAKDFYNPSYPGGMRTVELYDDMELPLAFVRGTPLFVEAKERFLLLKGSDRETLLELVDNAGGPVIDSYGNPQIGRERLIAHSLKPDLYRANVCMSDGTRFQALVQVAGGLSQEIQLVVPNQIGAESTSALQIAKALPPELADRLLPSDDVTDTTNARQVPSASAILAQAASLLHLEPESAASVAKIGLTPLSAPEGGIRVMLAVDGRSPDDASDLVRGFKLALSPLDSSDPKDSLELKSTGTPFVAMSSRSIEPGAYRLHYHKTLGGNRRDDRAQLALSVVPGHLVQLIFYEDSDGAIQLTQCAPSSTRIQDSPTPAHETVLLDRIQRELRYGKRDVPRVLVQELLEHRTIQRMQTESDPFASAMALYFLSLQGDPARLRAAATDVARIFPSLPDGHVALAWSLESGDGVDVNRARLEYTAAISHGLPVLQRFLQLLRVGVERYNVEGKEARLKLLYEADRYSIPLFFSSAWRLPAPPGPD